MRKKSSSMLKKHLKCTKIPKTKLNTNHKMGEFIEGKLNSR